MYLLRLLIVALNALAAPQHGVLGTKHTVVRPGEPLAVQTRHYRRETWRWQRLMGVPRTPSAQAKHSRDLAFRRWLRTLWKRRAAAARRSAKRPPHYAAWLCIHRYEGGWKLVDGPYYGGLQMNLEFQRRFGRRLLAHKGTANHWTPVEQMWVAERAYRSGLGFRPWPNTARMCGLL